MKYTDDHKNLSNVKKATENPEPLFELRIDSDEDAHGVKKVFW